MVTSLFHDTCLKPMLEQLLSPGCVCVRKPDAQIAYTDTNHAMIENGARSSDNHPKDYWHVDSSHGKFASVGTDFIVLVGIALSEGQHIDENRGQFTYFPGRSSSTSFLHLLLSMKHLKPTACTDY